MSDYLAINASAPVDEDYVRRARAYLGLSTRQLGRALGLSEASADRQVRRWERGVEVPGPCATALRYMVTHGLDDIARRRAYKEET